LAVMLLQLMGVIGCPVLRMANFDAALPSFRCSIDSCAHNLLRIRPNVSAWAGFSSESEHILFYGRLLPRVAPSCFATHSSLQRTRKSEKDVNKNTKSFVLRAAPACAHPPQPAACLPAVAGCLPRARQCTDATRLPLTRGLHGCPQRARLPRV
jgi:hypothetical protein